MHSACNVPFGFRSSLIFNVPAVISISFFRIKGNGDSDLTAEDMETFHNVLYGYLNETYGINFEKCTLTNICLPALSAASTGYVS